MLVSFNDIIINTETYVQRKLFGFRDLSVKCSIIARLFSQFILLTEILCFRFYFICNLYWRLSKGILKITRNAKNKQNLILSDMIRKQCCNAFGALSFPICDNNFIYFHLLIFNYSQYSVPSDPHFNFCLDFKLIFFKDH